MCRDGTGDVVVTGEFNGTVNFGDGDLTSSGFDDIFVAKFQEGTLCGDVHPAGGGDGDDDVLDAVRKLKMAVGLVVPTPRELIAGDVHPDNDPPAADGDVDVLSATSGDDTVAWYSNQMIHRGAAFAEKSLIAAAADGAYSVYAADLDGDGDVDALSASQIDNTVAWYENTDGHGSSEPPQPIDTFAL